MPDFRELFTLYLDAAETAYRAMEATNSDPVVSVVARTAIAERGARLEALMDAVKVGGFDTLAEAHAYHYLTRPR